MKQSKSIKKKQKKCGIKVDTALLTKVAKGLGPSLYKADAEK